MHLLRKHSAHAFALSLTASAAPLAFAAAQPALAQSAEQGIALSIPAQPVPRALAALSSRTGVQILYTGTRAYEITSKPVSGHYTADQALRTLLGGTGISYSFVGANAVTISVPGEQAPQVGASVDSDAIQLETIEVGVGGGADAADLPYESAASSVHIDERTIQRFRGSSPGDFLNGQPGVMVGDVRNSGAVDINVRGIQGMDRVPVVLDGSLQSNTLWQGYAGVATRTYIDPDMIGSVTVEKGPSAAPDAVGATGGVARMSTIAADDILLDGKSVGVRIRGGLSGNTTAPPVEGTRRGLQPSKLERNYAPAAVPSEWGYGGGFDRPSLLDPTGGSGSIAAAGRNENVEVVGAFSRRKSGNYFAGTNGDAGRVNLMPQANGQIRAEWEGVAYYRAGEEVLNSSQDTTSWLFKTKFNFENDSSLELGYIKYLSTYFDLFPGAVGFADAFYQNSPSSVDVDTYTAQYKWNPADNDLIDLKAVLWRTDTEFYLGRTIPVYILQGIFPDYIYNYWSAVSADRWGINVSNTSNFDTGMGRLALNYGVSYTDESMEQFQGGEAFPALGMPAEDHVPGKSGNRQEVSAFAASQWEPTDWLKIDSALRYTYTKSHDDCLVSNAPVCAPDMENDGIAPITAVTIEPWQGVQGYVRYAEAIRSASLYEATSGESFTVVDLSTLKPEHARNWEFGVNVLRDGVLTETDKVRFKGAYFINNIDDYLTRNNAPAGSNAEYIMTNIDSARLEGFEISLDYDRGVFFGNIGYTHYTKTEYCLTDEQWSTIANNNLHPRCNAGGIGGGYVQMHVPPKDRVILTLGTRLFDETLTLGSRYIYTGNRPVQGMVDGINNSGSTVLTKWTPYTTIDVFANWKINENVEAEFTVENVTDEYYIDALSIGFKPAPGRTARVGLTAKF